jgi:hypothetical protein
VAHDRLELREHAVEEDVRDEMREYVGLADQAYRRMRRAYLGSS